MRAEGVGEEPLPGDGDDWGVETKEIQPNNRRITGAIRDWRQWLGRQFRRIGHRRTYPASLISAIGPLDSRAHGEKAFCNTFRQRRELELLAKESASDEIATFEKDRDHFKPAAVEPADALIRAEVNGERIGPRHLKIANDLFLAPGRSRQRSRVALWGGRKRRALFLHRLNVACPSGGSAIKSIVRLLSLGGREFYSSPEALR